MKAGVVLLIMVNAVLLNIFKPSVLLASLGNLFIDPRHFSKWPASNMHEEYLEIAPNHLNQFVRTRVALIHILIQHSDW